MLQSYTNPGVYAWNYISYMQSPYHIWFVEMGYPELDILQYEDGEWHIFQYYNSPVVPALTKWQTVLGPMRNVPINYDFCHRFAHALDINRRDFWAREQAKSQQVEDEWERVEKHAEESATRATQAVMRNPDLVERIAKNGIQEINLPRILRHIPGYKL